MSDSNPSQILGYAQQALGGVESTVGAATGVQSWTEAGQANTKAGEKQVEDAAKIARGEGAVEEWKGKAKTGAGILMNDQDLQNKGNIQTQKGETKQTLNAPDIQAALPNWENSKEMLAAQAQSAKGMLTGNSKEQTSGNMRQAAAEAQSMAQKTFTPNHPQK